MSPAENEGGGLGTPADNDTTDKGKDSTPDRPTQFLDGATMGKPRPAPREPDVTHYRRRDSEGAS
jgi:hypothetical protein